MTALPVARSDVAAILSRPKVHSGRKWPFSPSRQTSAILAPVLAQPLRRIDREHHALPAGCGTGRTRRPRNRISQLSSCCDDEIARMWHGHVPNLGDLPGTTACPAGTFPRIETTCEKLRTPAAAAADPECRRARSAGTHRPRKAPRRATAETSGGPEKFRQQPWQNRGAGIGSRCGFALMLRSHAEGRTANSVDPPDQEIDRESGGQSSCTCS